MYTKISPEHLYQDQGVSTDLWETYSLLNNLIYRTFLYLLLIFVVLLHNCFKKVKNKLNLPRISVQLIIINIYFNENSQYNSWNCVNNDNKCVILDPTLNHWHVIMIHCYMILLYISLLKYWKIEFQSRDKDNC